MCVGKPKFRAALSVLHECAVDRRAVRRGLFRLPGVLLCVWEESNRARRTLLANGVIFSSGRSWPFVQVPAFSAYHPGTGCSPLQFPFRVAGRRAVTRKCPVVVALVQARAVVPACAKGEEQEVLDTICVDVLDRVLLSFSSLCARIVRRHMQPSDLLCRQNHEVVKSERDRESTTLLHMCIGVLRHPLRFDKEVGGVFSESVYRFCQAGFRSRGRGRGCERF